MAFVRKTFLSGGGGKQYHNSTLYKITKHFVNITNQDFKIGKTIQESF